MTEETNTDETPEEGPQPRRRQRKWWWQRQTVSQIRREVEADKPYTLEYDERDNIASHLPDGESVELGGIALAEVFTPSTVSRLIEALEERGQANPYDSTDRADHVKRSRTSVGGGWTNLGMVRRPGKWMIPNSGTFDTKLPEGVDAALLSVSTVTASVAVVTATFILEPKYLDIGAHLALDRRRTMTDVKVVIDGRLGKLRARIPWSRPMSHGVTSGMNDVWRLKEQSIENAIRDLEDRCSKWFYDHFPGRFSKLDRSERPHVRIILTENEEPFASPGGRSPYSAAGIGSSWGTYRGSEKHNAGWRLSTGSSFRAEHDNIWTFAARRSDVARDDLDDKPDPKNWSIVYRFSDQHSQLVALRALQTALQSYATDLANMRDRADRSGRLSRPVREAKLMNKYLLTTGLDLASVTSDVTMITTNLTRFRWNVSEYHEQREERPAEAPAPTEGNSLVPQLRSSMKWHAERLARTSADTDRNLRASAELQQAIANTRMQRVVLLLTAVAIVVAIIAV